MRPRLFGSEIHLPGCGTGLHRFDHHDEKGTSDASGGMGAGLVLMKPAIAGWATRDSRVGGANATARLHKRGDEMLLRYV
jgi:hypothetical protein